MNSNSIMIKIATVGMVCVLLSIFGIPNPLPYLMQMNPEGQGVLGKFPRWFLVVGIFVLLKVMRILYRKHGVIAALAYAAMAITLFYRMSTFGVIAQYFEPNRSLSLAATVVGLVIWLTSFPKGNMGEKQVITGGAFRLWAHPFYGSFLLVDATSFRPEWLSVMTTEYFGGMAILWIALLTVCYFEEKETMFRFGKSAVLYYRNTPSVHWLLWRLSDNKRLGPVS